MGPRAGDRIRIRLVDMAQRAISQVGCSSRTAEYNFVYRSLPGVGSVILDVGCCESLLALRLAGKGYKVCGFDARPYHERHPNLSFVQGDILCAPFPDECFDAALAVSTIEHVGLGAYGDPVLDDGDARAVAHVHRMLRPGGSFIVTAPFAGEYRLAKWLDGLERYYDSEAISSLFSDFRVESRDYFIGKGRFNWVNASEEEARRSDLRWHAIVALVLTK